MITKFSKPPRYKTPNFREKHLRNVTVDSEERVFLFDREASPLTIDERFHFIQEVLTPDDWERVRAFYKLPKTRRRSNKSGGVRRHEGYQIGLNPKRPIKDIQDERGMEAGEKSWANARLRKSVRAACSEGHCRTRSPDRRRTDGKLA